MKLAIVNHLKATNDTNGNPRRLYMVTWIDDRLKTYEHRDIAKGNAVITYHDEGYLGDAAIPRESGYVYVNGADVDIAPKQYNTLKKIATRG